MPLLRCFQKFPLLENWQHAGTAPTTIGVCLSDGENAIKIFETLKTLRQTMERARLLADMMRQRETLKRNMLRCTIDAREQLDVFGDDTPALTVSADTLIADTLIADTPIAYTPIADTLQSLIRQSSTISSSHDHT
jgi:hypothetical protein